MANETVELDEVCVATKLIEEEEDDEDIEVEGKEGVQNWNMALAFRAYKPGDGFLGWAAAKLLGKYGVMHCDLLLLCPCNEVRCGCDRGPYDTGCKSEQPHLRRCQPCRYRELEIMPRNMFPKMFTRLQNEAHQGRGHVHVVTFTALQTGVICRIEKEFNYHYFYRVHATPVQVNLAEEFMIQQIGAKYNTCGMQCNFIPCLPCCRFGATWDDFDPEMDPETKQVVTYSDKIVHWQWFCSEIVTATLCHIGLEGFTPDTREVGCLTEPCTISPDDLMGIVVERMKRQKQNRIVFSLLDAQDVERFKPDAGKKTQ